jgi:Mn2+/Fe2+ NRAMP family transporter
VDSAVFVINLVNGRRGTAWISDQRPIRDHCIVPKTGRQRSKRESGQARPPQFRRFFGRLGPGLITGAADDDPSGISTYSVTGAAFGYAPLWTALFSFPLMTAVQMMCARLGMVTGEGLAGVIRRRYPRWVLWSACALLVIANTVNIGADLGSMAKVTEMVTGIPSMYLAPVYALVIGSFLIWSSYYAIAEGAGWRGSLADRAGRSRGFYAVIAVGLALGLALDWAGFNAVSMLFWAAVLNGVLAPPLIVIVLLLTSSPKVMGSRSNPLWLAVLGWVTVAVMTAASCAMFATWK